MKKVKFKFPTLEDNYESSSIYDEAYKEAEKAGVMTKNRMRLNLIKHEIFTMEMQKEVDKIEAGQLFKYPEMPSFQDKDSENKFFEKVIVEVISGERIMLVEDLFQIAPTTNKDMIKYKNLININASYMRFTCEGLADKKRIEYLVSRCCYNADSGKRIWETLESYYNSRSSYFALALTSKFIDFIQGFNSTILRKLSRHPIWRTKWMSATKLGSPMFNGPISEWDTNKSYLCYWSNFLDNIYNGTDTPDDFIVKDDKLLDAWIESKHRESRSGNTVNMNDDGVRAVFKSSINPRIKS